MSPAAEDRPGDHPAGRSARHPAPDDIALLVDSGPEASDLAASTVIEHVAKCAACRQTLADIRDAREALAHLPAPTMPQAVAVRLERALAAEQAGRGAGSSSEPARGRPATWLVAAAAATVLVGGGALLHVVRGGGDGVRPSTAGRAAATAPSGSPGVAIPGGGPGTTADAAALPALVRSLLATRPPPRSQPAHTPMTGPRGGHLPDESPQRAVAAPAVAHCLTVLGISPVRLLATTDRTFAGGPATVLVLAVGGDPTLVDVRVVRPGCARGSSDLVYRLDRLRV